MNLKIIFVFNSVLLGIGLAMDAFSVSLANGLHDPGMKKSRMCSIAGVFALFQALMPMAGWICVHTVVQRFRSFEKFIPFIALILLVIIGGKMLIEGLENKESGNTNSSVGAAALLMQGIATSIDALSVGFTIAEYDFPLALVCSLIIAGVTFVICMGGLFLGKEVGTRFSNKATVFGGVILVVIGIEIFITGIM